MQHTSLEVRLEHPGDEAAIFSVNAAAFPTPDEASLVDALRRSGNLTISIVATRADQIVGHLAFSPVTMNGVAIGLGLAPIAVHPEHQRTGIGAQLIREGLKEAQRRGVGVVVVLGHPEYYRRFGFLPASSFHLDNEYGATDAFMALELRSDAIPAEGGLVRYGPEFGVWS